MKCSLVFKNSGDHIPFDVVHNQELFEYFVDCVKTKQFSDENVLANTVRQGISDVKNSTERVNRVVAAVTGQSFETPEHYLDQDFLNRLHADWVRSQAVTINIDQARSSNNTDLADIGEQLHEMYPDSIRVVRLVEAMQKLNLITEYEDVNMSVHRIESAFDQIEYATVDRYEVINNPYKRSMITSNYGTNLYFGYTYVGRQYFNKFYRFDTELRYDDHYNFETLENCFHLNLLPPQTASFSPEFLTWCQRHNVPPVGLQIPIGNVCNLQSNLLQYRQILYRNSAQGNRVSIEIQ